MTTEITIKEVEMESITVRLIGQTPLFINRMSAKAKRDLLLGGKVKTKADRAEIRHGDPVQEFRDSMLVIPNSHSSYVHLVSCYGYQVGDGYGGAGGAGD